MLTKKTRFDIKLAKKKKFVLGQTTRTASAPKDSDGKLKKMVLTRPKACPFCRNEDKITRLSNGKWKCKVCDYEWT